ncbi:pyridoxal-phosphate dependent enzyme [Chitinasiproducens palmae]|uniref:L-serine ammonia-lyase n=1 Tax=Chitinasiproducens palmae TaxID=1770053 RepID=A0A1H2PJZ1_9BURK|nr:pyridoxal-phosphate dependent enzyme [Chitinasiproducens palmae]SDV46697.1 L-serine/L-threonine ammonia-lyase [Chitinasiproducens palmae]
MPLHIETPLIESRAIGAIARRRVRLKMEALQPPGSFKIRGVGHACEHYARQGKRRFVSSSGGNAGIAAAYAGRQLGLPVTVVVPETTTELARQLIRNEAAELVVHGASWAEANALAGSLLGDEVAFIHPFDDPLLWTGHASMIDEAARQGGKPDAVVLSVGGGGLMCGVIEGLRRNDWADVPVIAAETDGTASLASAMAAGRRVTLDAIDSVATSLGAKQICTRAWQWTGAHPVRSGVVSDADALDACERFLDDHRVLVEPACGAALALTYGNVPALSAFEDILVIVCGGATASLDQIRAWRAALGGR